MILKSLYYDQCYVINIAFNFIYFKFIEKLFMYNKIWKMQKKENRK